MERAIKRLVKRLFPELTAGYHLPRFGQVVAVREAPAAGTICDDFRPVYAVDVQILDEQGNPDKAFPIFKDVPLPVPVAGHEMGVFAYPDNGTWVEIAFAYGSPNKPFIRCILPHGRSLIPVERGEQRWQHNPASYQRVDKNGSWGTVTDQAIHEQSVQRTIETMHNVEEFSDSNKTTEADDVHTIGGSMIRKAFGLMQLMSGGRFDIGALRDITITTKQKILTHADQDISTDTPAKYTLTTGGDINQTSETIQHLEAPLSWIGDADENALLLMSELFDLLRDLCDVLDNHTHPSTGQIDQGSDVTAISAAALAVRARLNNITEGYV